MSVVCSLPQGLPTCPSADHQAPSLPDSSKEEAAALVGRLAEIREYPSPHRHRHRHHRRRRVGPPRGKCLCRLILRLPCLNLRGVRAPLPRYLHVLGLQGPCLHITHRTCTPHLKKIPPGVPALHVCSARRPPRWTSSPHHAFRTSVWKHRAKRGLMVVVAVWPGRVMVL